LSRVEEFSGETLGKVAEEIPPEWYGGDPRVIERLMESLLQRRSRVRELIGQFRESDREPFPLWGMAKNIVIPRGFEMGISPGKFVN
jgi:hypothetical protein